MGIHYRVLEEPKLAIAAVAGRISTKDVLDYANQRLADPGRLRALDEVMDLREIALDSNVSSEGIRQLAEFWGKRSSEIARGRLAIIAPSDLSFGMSRMYEMLREGGPDSIRVFREPLEALRWLEVDEAVARELALQI